MTLFRSFRFRIAGLAVLLSSFVLAVVGISAWKLTERLGLDGIDQQLREELRRHNNESRRPNHWERFERQFENAPDAPRDHVSFAIVARARGDRRVIFQSSNWPAEIDAKKIPDPPKPPPEMQRPPEDFGRDDRPPLQRGPPGELRPPFGQEPGGFRPPDGGPLGPPPPISFGEFMTQKTKTGGWRVAVAGSESTTFIVAVGNEPLERNLAQLSHAMIAAAIPGLLLIAAMGGFIAARALKPVVVLTRTAEQITAPGLNQRLPATRDAAEFQRLSDVFNAMLDRLEKSFQQATRFSADAAHELKTPLTILQGQLEESLRESADGSPQQKLCADLLEEVQRLKNITRKLLLLSMTDAGELKLNREPVDLSAVVENAAEDAKILAPNLRIETNIAPSVSAPADPDLI
jgi:HAMP domain-containing protein